MRDVAMVASHAIASVDLVMKSSNAHVEVHHLFRASYGHRRIEPALA